MNVNTKNDRSIIFSGESLARKIKSLRTRLKLKQAELGRICGVSQGAIYKWEKEDAPSVPESRHLFKLSELAPEAERQWWRDQAARQVGFTVNASSPPGLTDIFPKHLRTIPLLKEARGMGTLALSANQIEREISFPAEWFPEGGAIRAVRVRGEETPEMIAIVDISRRDADRLVGHLVAVETPTGVEIRWLRLVDGEQMLLPFLPEQRIRKLRTHGENSIVGLVRWIGDSAEPPQRGALSN